MLHKTASQTYLSSQQDSQTFSQLSCENATSALSEQALQFPELSLRWRIYNRQLPLKSRHYQALRSYGLADGLVSWVIQHIEWTLPEGSLQQPHGVLTLDVDKSGKAAMNLLPFQELSSAQLPELIVQASCRGTRAQDGADSQVLWALKDRHLIILTQESVCYAAVHSLMIDLARYRKLDVSFQPPSCVTATSEKDALSVKALELKHAGYEFMLLSDEFGAVLEEGALSSELRFFVQSWEKLLLTL